MNLEVVPHSGWSRALRLANAESELVVTLDVGPRILSYRLHTGENVFKTFDSQLGSAGEAEWKIRGGHRLWIAPEDETLSYHIDNDRVDFHVAPGSGEAVIDSLLTHGAKIRKTLGVSLVGESSRATIRHTLTNEGTSSLTVAPWALSVMRPGGMAIIPQPPMGEHPRDLLPNRGMILWPYTDLSDPRWHFGQKFFTLRQQADLPPTKIGLAHREKWVAYVVGDSVFIKSFPYVEGATYADGGCNFETFTNSDMLEVESLGPLVLLPPGESITHTEQWYLGAITDPVVIESEDSLAEWLQPHVQNALT